MISLGSLQANGFSYRTDEDQDTFRVCKGARYVWVLTVMKAHGAIGDIFGLLESIVVG